MPRALTTVMLVTGTRRADTEPVPGRPVNWMVTSTREVRAGERVLVEGTAYTGVALSAIGPMAMGMIRVALRGRPRKQVAG